METRERERNTKSKQRTKLYYYELNYEHTIMSYYQKV